MYKMSLRDAVTNNKQFFSEDRIGNVVGTVLFSSLIFYVGYKVGKKKKRK